MKRYIRTPVGMCNSRHLTLSRTFGRARPLHIFYDIIFFSLGFILLQHFRAVKHEPPDSPVHPEELAAVGAHSERSYIPVYDRVRTNEFLANERKINLKNVQI